MAFFNTKEANSKFKQLTNIVKYVRNKDNEEDRYFYALTAKNVSQWEDDDLSREAIMVLLNLSIGLKENYDWVVRSTDWQSKIFPNESSLRNAYEELIEKGYARRQGDKVIIRNDKRVDFPLSFSLPSWNNKSIRKWEMD